MAAGRSSPTIRPTLPPDMSSRARSPQSSLRVPKQPRDTNRPPQLSPLPRFHPANWPSQNATAMNTPYSVLGSPQSPSSSPRQHHSRQISDVQRQLYMYQRDLMDRTTRGAQTPGVQKPMSPHLIPIGSPGPVTPLFLEEHDGYLASGARSPGQSGPAAEELVEKLLRQERRRMRGGMSPTTHVTASGR